MSSLVCTCLDGMCQLIDLFVRVFQTLNPSCFLLCAYCEPLLFSYFNNLIIFQNLAIYEFCEVHISQLIFVLVKC